MTEEEFRIDMVIVGAQRILSCHPCVIAPETGDRLTAVMEWIYDLKERSTLTSLKGRREIAVTSKEDQLMMFRECKTKAEFLWESQRIYLEALDIEQILTGGIGA
jgi:hypothetical protein